MSARDVKEAVDAIDTALMGPLNMDPDLGDAEELLDVLDALPAPIRLALARALVPELDAFAKADQLRIDRLTQFNDRLAYVKAEREQTKWATTVNTDHEWRVWSEAEKAMWQAARDLANACRAEVIKSGEEGV